MSLDLRCKLGDAQPFCILPAGAATSTATAATPFQTLKAQQVAEAPRSSTEAVSAKEALPATAPAAAVVKAPKPAKRAKAAASLPASPKGTASGAQSEASDSQLDAGLGRAKRLTKAEQAASSVAVPGAQTNGALASAAPPADQSMAANSSTAASCNTRRVAEAVGIAGIADVNAHVTGSAESAAGIAGGQEAFAAESASGLPAPGVHATDSVPAGPTQQAPQVPAVPLTSANHPVAKSKFAVTASPATVTSQSQRPWQLASALPVSNQSPHQTAAHSSVSMAAKVTDTEGSLAAASSVGQDPQEAANHPSGLVAASPESAADSASNSHTTLDANTAAGPLSRVSAGDDHQSAVAANHALAAPVPALTAALPADSAEAVPQPMPGASQVS